MMMTAAVPRVKINKNNEKFTLVGTNSFEDAQAIQLMQKLQHWSLRIFSMSCCSTKTGGVTALVTGIILILLGSLGGFLGFPALFKSEVRKQAVLAEGTDTWKAWLEPPIKIYMNFTFFNVENPEEVAEGGKPKLREVGPFVYEEKLEKIIVDPATAQGTILYKEKTSWTFIPELTLPLNDTQTVTIINPVLTQNGTDEGIFEIESGKNGPETLGIIRGWKNSSVLDYWPDLDGTNSCNKMNGTDGTIFAPLTIGTDKEKRLYLFVTDLCRSLHMTYNEDVTHFGITTRRYTVPDDALASPADNPANMCYCDNPEDPTRCFGSVLPLASCQMGAPVVMSTPHFYMTTTEELKTDFEGIKAVKEIHETYLDLDPIISVPLSARKRIQLNMKVKKSYPLPSFAKLKKEYTFPIMWVEEGADFDQASADLLNNEIYGVISALDAVRWTLIGLGIAVTLPGCLLLVKAFKKSKETV